jgi:hypothetical protein
MKLFLALLALLVLAEAKANPISEYLGLEIPINGVAKNQVTLKDLNQAIFKDLIKDLTTDISSHEVVDIYTADPHCVVTVTRGVFHQDLSPEDFDLIIEMIDENYPRSNYSKYTETPQVDSTEAVLFCVKRKRDVESDYRLAHDYHFYRGDTLWRVTFIYNDDSVYLSDFAKDIMERVRFSERES